MLDKWGIKSIGDLENSQKSKFFKEIKDGWKNHPNSE